MAGRDGVSGSQLPQALAFADEALRTMLIDDCGLMNKRADIRTPTASEAGPEACGQ